MSQRRQLRSRTDRTRNEPRPVFGRKLLCDFLCDPCRSNIDLGDFVLQIVFRKYYPRPAERIGLNHIATHAQKTDVDILNNVRPAEHQKLIATFLSPEIVHTGIARLDTGTHGAVVNHDALSHGLEKISHLFLAVSQPLQLAQIQIIATNAAMHERRPARGRRLIF